MTREAQEARRLYDVFGRYSFPGRVFCPLCYTPEEIKEITETPLADLGAEHGRTLLSETATTNDAYPVILPIGLRWPADLRPLVPTDVTTQM